MIQIRKHRLAFFLMSLSTVIAIVAPLFLITSCQNLQQTPQELKARETLRVMTRGGVLPSEDVVAKLENDFPRTTAGTLAKMVHARIKLKNNDYAGAAALLDSRNFADYTTIGDYALWLRGNALEQLNRRVEARAAYERLARDFPNALRTRDALLRVAQMLMQDGQAAAVPLMLKPLVEKNDATALLIAAKAYEQTGDSTRALANYRRIYFYASTSTEAADAAAAINRLGSSIVPANGEEANHRAMELFSTQRWSEAYDALTDALTRFPAASNRDIRV
ncbi:MAG TPA: tetratricopeptide repeat protein, partial [Pyrinomonadaceae bacterium]|nr:tetratricopeptide repeat protein [Pyrinomonadaceae bacterium]